MVINYKKIMECDKKFIMSASLRSFPDFIIVGAQKAGTTSIFNQLIKHPQILPPRYKEVHHYDLGVHMIGPRAANMIAEAVIVMECQAFAEDIGMLVKEIIY